MLEATKHLGFADRFHKKDGKDQVEARSNRGGQDASLADCCGFIRNIWAEWGLGRAGSRVLRASLARLLSLHPKHLCRMELGRPFLTGVVSIDGSLLSLELDVFINILWCHEVETFMRIHFHFHSLVASGGGRQRFVQSTLEVRSTFGASRRSTDAVENSHAASIDAMREQLRSRRNVLEPT